MFKRSIAIPTEPTPLAADQLSVLAPPLAPLADEAPPRKDAPRDLWQTVRSLIAPLRIAVTAVLLTWIFYATTAQMVWMITPTPLPTSPVTLFEPFQIANRYGLFERMTRGRYEIEFQGSNDGQTWTAYPFRHKPQELDKPPRYAPINLDLIGTCGSRRSASGATIRSSPHRVASSFEQPNVSRYLPRILFLTHRLASARRPLAILVYIDGRKASEAVVAPRIAWTLRSRHSVGPRRQGRRDAVAGTAASSRIIRTHFRFA